MAMYYGRRVAPKGDERIVAKSLLSGVAIALVILLLSAVNAKAASMDPSCKDVTIKDMYEVIYLGKERNDHVMECLHDYDMFRAAQASEGEQLLKSVTNETPNPIIAQASNPTSSKLLPLVQAHGMEAQAVYLEAAVNQLTAQLSQIQHDLTWIKTELAKQKVKGLIRDLGDNAKVMDHLDLLDGVE